MASRCAHVPLDIGAPLDPAAYDLLFIGGGQDKEQDEVARDLREVKAESMRAAIEQDMPVLAVCGGYQLLARYYHPAEGPDLEGHRRLRRLDDPQGQEGGALHRQHCDHLGREHTGRL